VAANVQSCTPVPPNHKYALLTFPVALASPIPHPLPFDRGLVATQSIQLDLPEHWQNWLGSIVVEELRDSQLCLWAIKPSRRSGILDRANQLLTRQVWTWALGLMISAPRIAAGGRLNLLVGGRAKGSPDVRQRMTHDHPLRSQGVLWSTVSLAHLEEAAEIAGALLQARRSRRLALMVRCYYAGLKEANPTERIHEFVRCIEGCLMPDPGSTKAQFKGRTEVFLGPTRHEWAEEVFKLRSAEEHLNNPMACVRGSSRDRRITILRRAHETQALARHCLHRIFTSPTVRKRFQKDDSLRSFWKLPPQERSEIWGPLINLKAIEAEFSDENIDWSS